MKCLIVSPDTLQKETNGGILQTSLFHALPKENLRHLVIPFVAPTPPDPEQCRDCRFLTRSGTFRPWNFEAADRPVPDVPNKTTFGRKVLERIKSNGLLQKLRTLREYLIIPPFSAASLRKEIEEYRPDVVYTLVANKRFAQVLYRACSAAQAPLFIHVMDDYIETIYSETLFPGRDAKLSRHWFQKLSDYASGRSGISVYMAEEYARRFGGDWIWFATLTSKNLYDPAPRKPDGTLRLLYTGQVGYGRTESLKMLADLLEETSGETGIPVFFEIRVFNLFLDSCRETFRDNKSVSVEPWVPLARLPGLFHGNDILVHVESFQPRFADYTKLSLSTKISQYMMAGRPVLSLGPPHVGSCRAVDDWGVGCVLDCRSKEETKQKLKTFLLDEERRAACAVAAREKAMEYFEIEKGSRRFLEELSKSVDVFHSREKSPIHWHNREDHL